ncbi:leucine-rich repeat-containing protein 15-like [Neocloeon triangulifer]|uniref:leucine-rich repeat-containing protein 15-like n=1 Tax=Neocloeon triangulifer TaxID=2078957 RepID=UPI00286F77C5|nr:leucine-rich repeat-containing protein 15-like [Neocloeon triangulifer]
MRCHFLAFLLLLTFASDLSFAGPILDTENDVPDDQCPLHCVCSSSELDALVKCDGFQENDESLQIYDLTGHDQGLVTRLEVTNSLIPTLKQSFLVGKRDFSLLRTLKLTYCEIEKINLEAFKGAYALEEIDLSNNDLQGTLHSETFKHHCPNLVLLNLKNNPGLKLPENKPFLKSHSIQEIDLSECGVTHVYQQSFAKLQRVTFISLEHNAIEYIHPEAFSNLPYLEELNLSFNSIINVPQNLPLSLQILGLRGNPEFNVSSLIDLNPNLAITELDISQCNIDKLPIDLFYNLPELINLNISNNLLTNLYSPFVLRQLRYLDISHNSLFGALDKNLFTHTLNMETLKLSWNEGLQLPEYGFLGDLTSLYFLDLSGCGMTEIRTASIDTLTSLAHLNLSHNALNTIPSHIFRTMPHLGVVDVSYNKLKLLPNSLFEDNPKLRHLYLGHNEDLDGVLKNNLLANNVGLKTLDISYCSYKNVPESLPQGLTSLNIAGNNINHPNILLKLVNSLPFLSKLLVEENPWKCSYTFTFLKNALESKGVENAEGKSWDEVHNSVCKGEHKSQNLSNLSFFVPETNNVVKAHFWSIMTFLLTLTVCIVIAVGCTVAYRSCRSKVKAKGNSKYYSLSESPTSSPAPHRIYKETTIPIMKTTDEKQSENKEELPLTFSKTFIFPKFPVTESDLPVSYLEGNYHHDELVP